jgi:MFS family permease
VSEPRAAVANRGALTFAIMLANIMQGFDTTIAHVALRHIRGSLSASLDRISWVPTSYIVAAAIMMPLIGWLADNPLARAPYLSAPYSLTDPNGIAAALNAEVMRQAAMVAYINEFALMMVIALASAALLLLISPGSSDVVARGTPIAPRAMRPGCLG